MSYDGGKGGAGVAQWIINQIPPHRRFISLFLGHCAVLRAIRPAEHRLGVEINADVAAFWADTRDLTVICGDALEALRALKAARQLDQATFVYADPPYLLETRSNQRPLYPCEFSDIDQHRALLVALRKLPCMVAISGYWSALYELELIGWRCSTFQTIKRSGELATECLWMNYSAPLELHDYRYLGSNFRERERIKRKKARWTERLRRMDALERLCLMEAIGELRSSITGNGEDAGAIATHGDVDEHHQVAPLDVAIPAGSARNGEGGLPRSK